MNLTHCKTKEYDKKRWALVVKKQSQSNPIYSVLIRVNSWLISKQTQIYPPQADYPPDRRDAGGGFLRQALCEILYSFQGLTLLLREKLLYCVENQNNQNCSANGHGCPGHSANL
jgi:hypothetical protein